MKVMKDKKVYRLLKRLASRLSHGKVPNELLPKVCQEIKFQSIPPGKLLEFMSRSIN